MRHPYSSRNTGFFLQKIIVFRNRNTMKSFYCKAAIIPRFLRFPSAA